MRMETWRVQAPLSVHSFSPTVPFNPLCNEWNMLKESDFSILLAMTLWWMSWYVSLLGLVWLTLSKLMVNNLPCLLGSFSRFRFNDSIPTQRSLFMEGSLFIRFKPKTMSQHQVPPSSSISLWRGWFVSDNTWKRILVFVVTTTFKNLI